MRLQSPLLLTLAVVALVPLAGCGGGGGGGGGGTGGTNPSPVTTTTTTTTMPAANAPTLVVATHDRFGTAPYEVGFNLCGSTDGSGGNALDYFADFDDGQGLQQQPGCGFPHTFGSDGVAAYALVFQVRDQNTGLEASQDGEVIVTAPINVQVTQSNAQACAGQVEAQATVMPRTAFGAHASVDRMVFTARNTVTGQLSDPRDGVLEGGAWKTGVWSVGFTDEVEVMVTPFASGVQGFEPNGGRPGCT